MPQEQQAAPPVAGHTLRAPDGNGLIQLHTSEYQALTNRNTYWTTIQMSVWIVIVAYLTALVPIWNAKPQYQPHMVWGTSLIFQLILAGWYFAGQEIYRNVYYLEHDLRLLIQNIVGEEPFWNYERFVATKSGKTPIWTDTGPVIGFLVAFVWAVWARYPLAKGEVIGLLANLPFTANLIWQARAMVLQRGRFEQLFKGRPVNPA